MTEHEKQSADCGGNCPAVVNKELLQRVQTFVLNDLSLGHIRHEHDRYYNFVCGKAQNKGEEDNAVQPDKACKGV